ncbi:two-component sensor histidine kinase [Scytonema sp. HK-05]|nr:two-component sensor histidine kinase [Scytonema sp. HK-05]
MTVILDLTDNYAVIQVQDTGIGIPQNELTRIFDRFYRVNSVSVREACALGAQLLPNEARSRSTGGSGLGLAISLAIVQAHYGSLNVQSELGKGSTFTVQLPFDITDFEGVHSIYRLKWVHRRSRKLK